MKKQLGMAVACLVMAGGAAIASIAVVENYAHEEIKDVADRNGLNGMLRPAAVDAYETAKDIGLLGIGVGAIATTVLDLGVRAVHRSFFKASEEKEPQQKNAFQSYAEEFLLKDIEEFRFWKALQSNKANQPITDKGTE